MTGRSSAKRMTIRAVTRRNASEFRRSFGCNLASVLQINPLLRTQAGVGSCFCLVLQVFRACFRAHPRRNPPIALLFANPWRRSFRSTVLSLQLHLGVIRLMPREKRPAFLPSPSPNQRESQASPLEDWKIGRLEGWVECLQIVTRALMAVPDLEGCGPSQPRNR